MIVGQLIYYLPLYFQSVDGETARESGISNLPFLVTMLFAPIISGALINVWGFYVPFMCLGAALSTIGAGLLSSLKVGTPKSLLSGYQFIAGFGLGICTQLPFTAVQYVLPKDQIVMGSAMVSFCNSMGPVLGTNIGQAIYANAFVSKLGQVANVDAAAVIRSGPINIPATENLPVIREAFNFAFVRSIILAIAVGGLAFGCSLSMEWGNVKEERRHEQ